MRYEQTIYIEKKLEDQIHKHLTVEPTCADECLGEDIAITKTAKFHNGIEMDIKCCGVQYEADSESNTAWTEAVLFKNGSEICCSEPGDEFMGEWILEYEGDEYVVLVKPLGEKTVYEVDLRDRTTGTSVWCIFTTKDSDKAYEFAEMWNKANVPEYDGNGNYVDYIDGTDGLIADVYETNVDQAKGIGPIAVKPNKRIVTDEPTLKNYIARYKAHKAHLEKHPEFELMLRRKIREAEEAILEIVTGDEFLKDMERVNLYKYL